MSQNPRDRTPFVAPAWVLELSGEDLAEIFGATTLSRGRAYQRQGRVHALRVVDNELTALVQGTHPYRAAVAWDPFEADPAIPDDIATECTCPVGEACKHAAATILEAQTVASGPPGPPAAHGTGTVVPLPTRAAPAPSWEDLLAPVVAEVQPSSATQTTTAPLALHLEASRTTTRFGSDELRLAMRPMIRGASGAWIKTGLSWPDLQYADHGRRNDPRQRSALVALMRAHQARAPQWQRLAETIGADALGPALWPLLRDVERSGVALVTGYQGKERVHLRSEPVEFVLDVTRGAGGQLLVRPVVDLPGAAGLELLGNPAHGLVAKERAELHLAALARPLTPAITTLLNARELAIPEADAERFLTHYYPALRQQATLRSSDGSVELPEIGPPRLGLEVRFLDNHVTKLSWSFRYAVGQQVHTVPLLRGTENVSRVVRDVGGEEELLASLDVLDEAPGLRVPLPGKSRLGVVIDPVLWGWATVQFVRDVLPELQERDDIDVTLIGEPLVYTEADEAPLVEFSTRDLDEDDLLAGADGIREVSPDTQDWFDLGIKVSVGGQPVPLSALLTALTRGEEQLLLPDGTWFCLDMPELHTLRRLVEEARALQDEDRGESLRINRFQAGLWEELVSLGVVAEQSERWQRTVGDLLALEELPHPEPPAGLTASLRDYQRDGYQWLSFLWEHELGGILADDMGLGKTVQVLAAAQRAHEQGLLSAERPMLVVAPTSVVGAWVREAERFTPGLRVVALTETVRRCERPLADTIAGAHIVVTSYALMRIDEQHLTPLTWSAVVLDEAQAVKNHRSRTYQAARSLRAPVKFAVTGTPLENSLMDLWSLLSISAPGLFSSPQRFGEIYRKPIESGSSPELLGTLRRRVRPLMLRRTKEAVATDLPPKIEQVLPVTLNNAHRRIYDTHLQRERQRILGLLGDVDRNRIAILSALTKLRQLSLDVHLVVPDAPESARPSKVDVLIEQLVEVAAEGHRCLVFSQFTRFLKIVRERLVAEGIGHVYLDGRTRDRPRRVAEFTDGDDPVFLISLKAGGSGLTLVEADYVFVLDPWWNPAVEAQAVDRTHRIGQDRTVMVYRLVAQDTIEEKVVALQEKKRDLFAKVVDEGGLMSAPLSADDIRGLLEG
ncbi:DEAD/DEAH box helicase [Ornithinimicrobium ciconiae]|uniref:DEAD/DEAH box helicase n=1 Tax=Ornithinimicrobium ciconiae TaxID=2594265 RepID=A0A516GD76_9MICO|nr:DEAD/DEAH box helicase [Ornithinimicrobium ciconiae]QDO89475.1 DEAD/DEAH box helicase [Ornithinimicrobium ciconiae]